MGKIRVKTLGVEELEKKQAEEAKKRRDVKKAKKDDLQRTEVIKGGRKGGERMKQVGASEEDLVKQEAAEKAAEEAKQTSTDDAEAKRLPPQLRRKKTVGKNYTKAQKSLGKDSDKAYSLKEAVKLLKKMSYAKFDETVELHINTREDNVKGEVTLPHGTGKELNIAIADDALLAKIENGEIDFDILISTPAFMPKLVKHARVLGPKGLMPNPKNGTVAEDPKKAAEKFKGGAVRYKTEPKFPLIHQAIGKMSFTEKNLVENGETLLNAVQKKNMSGAYLTGTMTPSVQLEMTS